MTENKRFEIISVDYTNIDIPVYVVKYGDVCFAVYEDKEDVQKVCDLLNELSKENQHLNYDNKRMVKFIMSKGYGLKDYLDFCKEYKE